MSNSLITFSKHCKDIALQCVSQRVFGTFKTYKGIEDNTKTGIDNKHPSDSFSPIVLKIGQYYLLENVNWMQQTPLPCYGSDAW